MIPLLEKINEELRQLEEVQDQNLIQPREDIGPGDTLLREMSPDLRRLWMLSNLYARTAALAAVEMKYGKGTRAEAYRTKYEKDVMHNLFWAAVNQEADSWDIKSIGVRKGWKIVKTEELSVETLESALKKAFHVEHME